MKVTHIPFQETRFFSKTIIDYLEKKESIQPFYNNFPDITGFHNQIEEKQFFEKNELKVILDLYAKMVSAGSWKDYGLNISNRQVSFSVFKNAAENALYKICKNFKPSNKNLKYLITDSNGKVLKNSFELEILLKNTNWKNLKK